MDSAADRSQKKLQSWKKYLLHFSFCFVAGLLAAFAQPATTAMISTKVSAYWPITLLETAVKPSSPDRILVNDSLLISSPSAPSPGKPNLNDTQLAGRCLVIVVTTTWPGDVFQDTALIRLAQTLRLVPPPLLWIVVEARSDDNSTAKILWGSGVLHRHLTYERKLTDTSDESDHQRNLALKHITVHRLAGAVHFGGSNIFDLFHDSKIDRHISVWPVVTVSPNRRKVVAEGPICNTTNVVGWFSEDLSSGAVTTVKLAMSRTDIGFRFSSSGLFGIGFNSSILWEADKFGSKNTSARELEHTRGHNCMGSIGNTEYLRTRELLLPTSHESKDKKRKECLR